MCCLHTTIKSDDINLLNSHHIPILDPLRGTAALAVCVFHFSVSNSVFLNPGDPVAAIGSFGSLGVDMFFVISGFVIPYSMYLRSYRLRDIGPFFVRRLKRLEPPYFACIGLVIILQLLSEQVPGFRGDPFDLSWQQLVAHVAYLNTILDYGWLNPVFWTLAIEFQFYIFVAIMFPCLVHTNAYVLYLSAPVFSLIGYVELSNLALLPHWLPLFAIGMAAFQFYIGRLSTFSFLLALIFIGSCSYSIVGLEPTIVGLFTGIVIVVVRDKKLPRFFIPFSFLGTISYSLYLLHFPIGMKIINLAGRLPESTVYRYPAIVVALVISVIASCMFRKYVERPSQLWAKGST